MLRPTLSQWIESLQAGASSALGICAGDVATCAATVNEATQRLLYAREASDSGAFGSWLELAFTVDSTDPYLTTPRGIGRLGEMLVCTNPVPVQNQFYEYLRWGWGRWPKSSCQGRICDPRETYERGVVPLFSDIVATGNPKKVRIYLGDSADVGLRVLLQYKDANGLVVRSLDGLVQVTGEFLDLAAPSVDSTRTVSVVTGVQKDVTLGTVSFYELDTVTGDERLILTMEPGETVAAYRRYYLGGLPKNCCDDTSTSTNVSVTALARVEFVPVRVPTDYLVIPNVEALTQEAQAARYGRMDDPSAKQMEAYHHRAAIRSLNGQLVALEGKLSPAVLFAPFGDARLEDAKIGLII